MRRSDAPSIYLVRAAGTGLSAEGRLSGRLDPPLDERGLRKAREAGLRLARAGVAGVYSSPLTRARMTADAIASQAGVRVQLASNLIDVDAGAWTGLTRPEMRASRPEEFDWFFRLPRAGHFPGGERMSNVQDRIFAALDAVRRRMGERSAAVVTHEIPIRIVLVRMRELEGTAMWDPEVPTGSVTRLRVGPAGLEIRTVLEDLLRAAGRRRS
jgi:broad specificity phosphatase PhoE